MISAEQFQQRQTEQYALELEEKENLWHAQHDDEVKRTRASFDLWLAGSKSELSALQAIFSAKNFMDVYANNEEMAWLFVLYYSICQEEEIEGCSSIFALADNADDLRKAIQQFQFLCWQIEFGQEYMEEQLVGFVTEKQLSPAAISLMLMFTAYDKRRMYMQMASAFLDAGMFQFSVCLLEFALNVSPSDMEIEGLLADLYQVLEKGGSSDGSS